MSLDQLRSLQADPRRRRLAELAAIAHAVRPIASDFASTLLFYALLAAGAGVRGATLAGVGLGLGQLAFLCVRRRRASAMQVASVLLIIAVGGVTLLMDDPRVMFWKVSAVYFVIGAAMLRPGWMGRYVPPIAVEHLGGDDLRRWELAWAALLLCTSAFNLALTSSAPAKTTALVIGVTAPTTKLLLFGVQYAWLRRRTRLSMRRRLQTVA